MIWQDRWNYLQTLSPREKYAEAKRLAFAIKEATSVNQIPQSEIDEAIEVFNKCLRLQGGNPQMNMVRSKLIMAKQKGTDRDQINIISKLPLVIGVESGTLLVADPDREKEFELVHFDTIECVKIMNKGQGLVWSTGGDGTFDIQLRLVEASEPMLMPKEYKLVTGSTDTIVVEVKSGKLTVGDFGLLQEQNKWLTVEPGNYKVCAYLFDTQKDFLAYYVVVCKTDDSAVNDVSDIFDLQI
jgi:hypothetical protein